MNIELSIVTITFNNLRGLQETIRSLQIQNLPVRLTWELIVIDNLSTDGTERFLREVTDLPIRSIRESDGGIYDALNKGTSAARGDLILYLNAGDVLRDPLALQAMLIQARRNPKCSMTVSGAVQRNADGSEYVLRNVPHHWFPHAYGLRSQCHAAVLFRRSFVIAAGGYSLDADFAGDFDLILRLGLITPVASQKRVCITYDGTGLSAARKKEIPLLLHRIRTERLGYPRWARIADLIFLHAVKLYRAILGVSRIARPGHRP